MIKNQNFFPPPLNHLVNLVYSYKKMRMLKYIHAIGCFLISVFAFAQVVNGQTNTNNEAKANKVQQSVELNNQAPSNINPAQNANFSNSAYETESSRLSREILFNPKSEENWGNYYRSERYSHYSKNSNDISKEEQKDLDVIIKNMEEYVPNSYEFHFLTYLNGNKNPDLVNHLQKAYEIKPKSTEVMTEYVSYYEMTNNDSKKKEFCKLLSSAGVYSADLLEFNYNLLNSVEQNAILITHGENDTYPVWIQQTIKNVRPDVKVLYIDLLENKSYREKELKELGITVSTNIETNKAGFLKELAEASKKRPVYFANTVAPDLLKPMNANLYLTGLAFKYSSTSFDNLSTIESNWKDKMVKTELNGDGHVKGSIDSKMNLNYLPSILLLYEKYKKDGNKEATQLKELALKLGSEGGKEHQVRLYLDK